VTLSAGSALSLSLTNLTIGLMVHEKKVTGSTTITTYALEANEGQGSVTTLSTGPNGLSLSASDLVVRVKRGLDPSTIPSGVPHSVSLPGTTQTTTETASPTWSATTTITLQHAVIPSTLVVTYTSSSAG